MSMRASDDEVQQLVQAVQSGTADPLGLADRAIALYPDDARLHFLRGSLLAGMSRPIEAHAALGRAVALAPEFTLARFQLGFFELTSGEAERALATWEPLDVQLSDGDYLAHFVAGLRHLVVDRFADAIVSLEAGIAVNGENPPLNHDMELIIGQCRSLVGAAAPAPDDSDEASATSFLLNQLGRGSIH